MHNIFDLKEMELEQLRSLASELQVKGTKRLDKDGLVYAILDREAELNAKNAPAKDSKPKRGRPKKDSKPAAEAKTEAKEAVKEEPKAEVKSEVKTEVKAETKTEVKTENTEPKVEKQPRQKRERIKVQKSQPQEVKPQDVKSQESKPQETKSKKVEVAEETTPAEEPKKQKNTDEQPCDIFRKIKFPTNDFFPPRPCDLGDNHDFGCCDHN